MHVWSPGKEHGRPCMLMSPPPPLRKLVRLPSPPPPHRQALQALEAGSVAALPDAVRAELEDVERSGGLKHLQEVAQQVKVWDKG